MLRFLCMIAGAAGAASASAEPAATAVAQPAALDSFSLAPAEPSLSVTESAAFAAGEAMWLDKDGIRSPVKAEIRSKPFKLTDDAEVRMRDVPLDFSRISLTGARAGNDAADGMTFNLLVTKPQRGK